MQKSFMSKLLGVIALCLLLLPAAVTAQSISGELVGTIYDATGAIVAGASVVATHSSTGVQSSTVSSSTGQYRIGNLPVGSYSLKVTAKGFSVSEIRGVEVSLNMQATSNVTLQIGESKTVVEVTGSSVTIDTTTAQVESTFDAQQLADLPTTSGGSGVLNLALYTSGVSTSGAVGVGTGPSVGGQRPRNNNFTIEGIDNNNKGVTGPIASIPNDAVAEFSILSNQFSAEYGHSSGGQFNQVLKGGTNEFHGMAYEYLSNRTLNALDQQDIVSGVTSLPRYDNNRFGGNIGGPIKKNKLFFFFDYEYNPVGQSGVPGAIYAPTTDGYATLAGIPGINQTNLGILKQYLPAQSTAIAGASIAVCPGTQMGLTNGACPAGATQYQIPYGQYSFTAPLYTNNYTYVISSDYTISDKDQLRGRYVRGNSTTQDTAAQLPAFWIPLVFPTYLATLTEFHNFSPSVTNEFRLGFNRFSQDYPVGSQKFPGLDQFPNLQFFDLNGVQIGADPNAPQTAVQNTYQITDNFSWLKGAHTITAGGDFRKYITPQTFTQRGRGDYEYSYVSDYLFDYIPDYLGERTTGNLVYYGDQIQFGAYVNDSWKVKPNFTINLGVRYERTTIPYAERLQTVNAISSVPGLINFGEPKVQNLNFEPRVGVAWSPGTSGKTSIRAGFGINYDQLFDNLGLLTTAPQFQQTVDVGGNAGSGFLAGGGIPPNASSGSLDQATARAETGGYVPDQKLPKSLQWNIGIQRVVHEDYTVELRYLGTRGLNLPIQDRLDIQDEVTPQYNLPVYLSAPSQGTLDGLTNTLSSIKARGHFLPQYADAGFQSNIVAYMPMGASTYHGLAAQVTRRFHNGLQFVGAYTFSHNIDNSTAEVFSTYTTPRRGQDFQNLNGDRSSSALDHRNRFTMATVYDMPFFKNSNWLLKNIVGNWEFAPIYTYETGTLYTIQSGIDSNLNGDSAGDRTWINASGTGNIGSSMTALTNSAGATVAYLVNNPQARYVQAPSGVLTTGGRNTAHLRPIDNVDFSLLKRFNVFKENKKLEFGARFYNFLNHPQYTGSHINDVASVGYTGGAVHDFLIPGTAGFYDPTQVFSSNPRSIQLSGKFIF
jgi:outer membrane receptor protein involved in Fe transport